MNQIPVSIFLFIFPQLTFQADNCQPCKSVEGSGPLAGEYTLEEVPSLACPDQCAYRRKDSDDKDEGLYCFLVTQGEYSVSNCACVVCGDRCLEPYEAPLFTTCQGTCQSVQVPCNGTCPGDTVPCADFCLTSDMVGQFHECDGVCLPNSEPCRGECMTNLALCDRGEGTQGCVAPGDADYYDCGGACQHVSLPCNDTCPVTTWMCGGECVDLANTSVTDCGGTCQSVALPCNTSCPLGFTLCNGTCHLNTGDTWACDTMCIPASDTCHGRCPPGRLMSASGGCLQPSEICPDDTSECQDDQDCQEGASCVLQGSRFYCQCRLGYRLTARAEATCPHTGACVEMVNGVTECDCYGDICPFCNATTMTSSGPVTYNFADMTDKKMMFSRPDTSCSVWLKYVCWYDLMDVVTAYITASIQETEELNPCSPTFTILTPLACDFVTLSDTADNMNTNVSGREFVGEYLQVA